MKFRPHVAVAALFALAVLLAAAACSRQPTTAIDLDRVARPSIGPSTPGDSTPGGDSIPGDSVPVPPPPILPVAFAGADSAYPGTTAELRWAIGNESSAKFRVDYTLECALPWPGFPRSGHIDVAAETVAPLSIPVLVPDNAAEGMVEFTMTVTRPNGIPPTSASGSLRVWTNDPPPPPPPPPVEPVWFVGSDTAQAGTMVSIGWRFTNESQAPFTMRWTLQSLHGWAGYPATGTVDLLGGASAEMVTTTAVPDTAGPGPRRVRMTVTRPNGLPPASMDGLFNVIR